MYIMTWLVYSHSMITIVGEIDHRRERALKKMAAKGIQIPPPSKQQQQQQQQQAAEKSLEDLLSEPFPESSKHKFEIRIVSAQATSEEFMKSFEESMQVSL